MTLIANIFLRVTLPFDATQKYSPLSLSFELFSVNPRSGSNDHLELGIEICWAATKVLAFACTCSRRQFFR